MKRILKQSLVAAALMLAAPLAVHAQTFSCPGGATPIVIPGVGTFCPATVTVPEINPSASMGGLALLASGLLMLSGRKKALSN